MRQNLFSFVIALFLGVLFGFHGATWADALGPLWERTNRSLPAAVRTDRQSQKIIEVNLKAGIEGNILHLEQVFGKDFAYVHFINGPYQGKRGWVPILAEKNSVRFYAVKKNQAFQIIDAKDANFARTTDNVTGLLNLDFIAENLDSWEYVAKDYTVDFFARYPRTLLTKVAEVSEEHWNNACPHRPYRKSGKPCDTPPKRYNLPSWIVADIKRASKRFNVHPAIVAAIIQKESYFNPFSENQYEKMLCEKQKRLGKKCAEYGWGQGLSQLGATNSKDFKLRWQPNMKRPKACKKGRHIWRKSCYNYLVRSCRAQIKKTGFAATYCPRESVSAVANYVSNLINSEHFLRVDIVDNEGSWNEKIINVKDHMRRTLAEEFRYIVGMYNRGKRPINSVEEHFRQYGKAPEWYDVAWTTQRVEGITPSPAMGYMILYKESINRCHVWQVAGLCGLGLGNSLSGQYLELFPGWPERKRRVVASDVFAN